MPRSVTVALGLPPAPGPSSHAVQAGGWVFTAGMLGLDRTGEIAGPSRGDAGAQTRRAIDNLALALDALGIPLAHMAKIKGYLTDFRHAPAYNAAYREAFAPPWPARATVGAGLVRDHALVALEATAAVGGLPRAVRPAARAEPPVPLTQGMQAAGVLFASGQLARDASGALIGRGDLRAQAEQALDNLGTVLDAAGLDFTDVVKINATVPDWTGLSRYHETLGKYFAEPLPARAVTQGAPGVEGMLIEIEAVAVGGPRRVVSPDLAPGWHAVEVGTLVHLAGEADTARRLAAAGDVRAQTRRTMESLRLCLAALGGRMGDIVKTNVTLTDPRLVPAFDEEYRTFFTPPYPARTTVVGGLARERMLVEIEAVAVLGAAQDAIAVTGPANPA
ncbi:MAG TPA: RidA family protein [Candidatus Limnocylindria bacterium]|nr:RidA family protein [Candidatus Limnocylindria bacterium]